MSNVFRYEARRQLAKQHHYDIGSMQATAARIVGTHINSPLRIYRTRSLGINLLPSWAVEESIRRSKGGAPIKPSRLYAHLTDGLPTESGDTIIGRVESVSVLGQTALRRVSLNLYSEELNREQETLISSLEEMTNVDCKYKPSNTQHLHLMTTDPEHQSEVVDALERQAPETLTFERLEVMRSLMQGVHRLQKPVA